MIKPDAPGFPLLGYIDELVNKLRDRVPAALSDWDPAAIHEARVTTRRLKAALELLKPVLSKSRRQPFAKILKKLRRRLGPLRDIDVMLEHVNDIQRANKFPAAVLWLTQHLYDQRERVREKSTKQGAPADVLEKLGSWWGLREEVTEAHEATESLLAESLHLQTDAFVEQADRFVAGSRGERQSAHQDPHEMRIAGKALRYTLEMAQAQGHDLPKSVTKTFKRMQEMLGLWHDYVVLTERAMRIAVDELLAHHDGTTQAEVLELAQLAIRRAGQQLAHFSTLWIKDGAAIAAKIRSSFPLTQPVLERKDAAAARDSSIELRKGPGPTHSISNPDSAPAPGAAALDA